MWWCQNLLIFVTCFENFQKKIQHGSEVDYVIIFLVENVDKVNEDQSLMIKTKQIYNLNIFSQ